MRVIAQQLARAPHPAPSCRAVAWRTIPELFAEADVISLHCPLTADNARFVNRDLLARVQAGARC